ncbi:hypothetical protein KKH18_06960 [bacterium]|nr:hypothetical protein [bacterium]
MNNSTLFSFLFLLVTLVLGCTDENNYYTLNSQPDEGVQILYPTATDTIRIYTSPDWGADTIVYGRVRASLPAGVFSANSLRMDRDSCGWYANQPVTYPTAEEFALPILREHTIRNETDNCNAGVIEGILPCWIRIVVADNAGAEWYRTVSFHIAYIDTTH